MDIGQYLPERAPFYALLSRLISYPLGVELLEMVTRLSLREELEYTGQNINTSLGQMQLAIASDSDLEKVVETLNREATRLFEGPGKPAAPPYGSYYLNGKRLMGPEAAAVRQAYLSEKLLPELDGHIPPDHLALELGFLSVLAEKRSQKALNALHTFLERHILSWLPAWREDVHIAQPHPFFKGLVDLIQTALEADLNWLNENNCAVALFESSVMEVPK
ncbi:MAG TPA: molecular chaperone TorD family protein [Anaerolineales bacterium]